jgi:hypothetical protein
VGGIHCKIADAVLSHAGNSIALTRPYLGVAMPKSEMRIYREAGFAKLCTVRAALNELDFQP